MYIIMTLQELKDILKTTTSNKDAIAMLTDFIYEHPENDEAYTMRGMRHWGDGNRSLAIEDYLSAIRINPESKAKEALKAVNEILDYRNKDLYNP